MRVSILLLAISILGAVSGYLRELSLASTFGASHSTDAYFIAFSIPTTVGDLLIGSALVASIVPTFTRISRGADGGERRSDLFALMAGLVLASGSILAVVGAWAMPQIISSLAPGFDPSTHALAVHYGRALVWLLPVNGLLLLCTQTLNASLIFVLPATSGFIANLMFFASVFLGHDSWGRDIVLLGAVSGPSLMLAATLIRLRPLVRWRLGAISAASLPLLKDAIRLARPVLITLGIGSGLGLLTLSHVLVRASSTTLGEGAASALSYAFRIYEAPITLLTSTAGVLILPAFANLYHDHDVAAIRRNARDLLGWTLPVLLPAAISVYLLAAPLVRLLFYHGRFGYDDMLSTIAALHAFTPAIVFETVFMILYRVFYALRRPGMAVGVSAASIASLLLMLTLLPRGDSVFVPALKLSTSFAVAAGASLFCVHQLLGREAFPSLREILVQVAAASLPLLPVIAVRAIWSEPSFAAAIVDAALYAAGYLVLAYFLMPRRVAALFALRASRRGARDRSAG